MGLHDILSESTCGNSDEKCLSQALACEHFIPSINVRGDLGGAALLGAGFKVSKSQATLNAYFFSLSLSFHDAN